MFSLVGAAARQFNLSRADLSLRVRRSTAYSIMYIVAAPQISVIESTRSASLVIALISLDSR